MGTHISRVKSVDLDAWTDEQLQSVLKWGNSRANKYWEAKLQPGHVPSESKIENFIRTKYESKRWVMEGPMPDPSTLGDDDDVPLNVVQEKAKIERSASQKQTTSARQAQPPAVMGPPPQQASVNLFDDFEPPARPSTTGVVPNRPAPPPQPAAKPASQSNNLMGLDFFGAPQSAGVGRPSSAASNPIQGNNARSDLKSSILSLYASAPKPQPAPQPLHDRQASFGGLASPAAPKQDAFGGLADAFGGMSFSSGPPTARSPPVQSSTSAFDFPSPVAPPPPQSSSLAGLSFPSTVPAKANPSAAQVTSPPPLSGGDFFSTTSSKSPAPKPAATRQPSNALNFSFTQAASPPPTVKPQTTSVPADLFADDGFNDFTSAPTRPPVAPAAPAAKFASPPNQRPAAFDSAFNLSSATTAAPGSASASQPTRPAMTSQSSASMFDPWGGADTNAWGGPEPPKPAAPKVELGSVPSRITPNDISGGWGAPISSASKPTAQPTVTADEDFGGWTSAATPAASKPSGGFGASDPFDNPWG